MADLFRTHLPVYVIYKNAKQTNEITIIIIIS